jgi:hypothetical protein
MLFPPAEFIILQQSVASMVSALDNAQNAAIDPFDGPAIITSHAVCVGKVGRPRIEIDATALEYALQLRGPSKLSNVFHCSARTVRRRALENGISVPGVPVYTTRQLPGGGLTREYNQQRQPSTILGPELSDEQLDDAISAVLQVFPKFGRGKIKAALETQGLFVTQGRILQSRIRVQGAPAQFGQRTLHRRKYFVPGANSLWHHDGQHGRSFYISSPTVLIIYG